MPAALLACAWLLGASLSAAPALELGLTAEARARTTATLPGDPQRTAEGELSPWIRLRLGWSRLELGAEYRPTLTVADTGGGTALLLHQAALSGRWQRDPGWLVSAQVTGRLGDVSGFQLLQAAGPSGGPVQLVPTLGAIGYRSLEGILGLGASEGPRLRALVTLTAAEEGGATLADQRWLPLLRRLRVLAGLEWEAGIHDVLATTLDVVAVDFSSGPAAGAGILLETWRRTTSASFKLWGGAGPAVAVRRADGVTATALRPAAELGAEYDGRPGGTPVTARLVAALGPFVDRVTSEVPARAGVTALVAVLPARAWRLEATGSSGRVLEGPQRDDTAWAATAKVGRSLGAFVEASTGVRALLQQQPRFSVNTLDWQVFLAVEVHPRRPDLVEQDPAAVKDPLRPRTPGGAEEPVP